jgi:hypothetical protein
MKANGWEPEWDKALLREGEGNASKSIGIIEEGE